MVSELSTFVSHSTASNYSGHSNKEQGAKDTFVRFSEQPTGITTVYREQKKVWNSPHDRFWGKHKEPAKLNSSRSDL
jgi:hypothetical protein